MDTLEKRIMNIIKQRASLQGVTQQDLSKELKVSLITIKRWYAGKGLKISNLEALCNKLSINISEIISLASENSLKTFYYTQAQEEALAHEPKLLALFDLLIGGFTLTRIKKKYKIDDKMLTALLLKLDRIKLIELGANNKVKLLVEGEPAWNPTGALAKKFRMQMITEFLGTHDRGQSKFFIHDYLSADVEQIKKKVNELEQYMLHSNSRARLNPLEATSYGSYLQIKEYEWNVRSNLES
jgi:DNA-binding Xre family transcriptional regulator